MNRQQAKNLGEWIGIITLGCGIALLWMPFIRIIVDIAKYLN